MQYLPAIEQSAGERFRAIADLAWIADDANLPEERHLELLAGGACWVAGSCDGDLAGFLSAEVAGDSLHIWEMAVLHDRQGRGIGRALLSQAIAFALAKNLRAVTLSTFRDVPWNEPMYRRRGFKTLGPEECDRRLMSILAREIANGLPGDRRCALRLALDKQPSA